jgi:ABC-type transport system involved in cytochrome c biogenesis permease subunit
MWNDGIGGEADRTHSKSAAVTLTPWRILQMAGSLKITVAMFALGLFILLVGTIAQDEESIPNVKKLYFNSFIALVPLDVFFPQTLYPHDQPIPGQFPIPGGATVGFILLINLIAAKLTRFTLHAKGSRLIGGLIFTLIGFALIGVIIVSAHQGDGIQGEPPISYDALWWSFKASIWVSAVAALVWSVARPPKTQLVLWLSRILAVVLVAISIYLLFSTARIGDPGLRIVWQLGRSLAVSVALLVGLIMLFGKRGGNVLIHLAVALMMLGQFLFGDKQIEERITLKEKQTTNESYRLDEVELAFVDPSQPDKDRVVAISSGAMEKSKANKSWIEFPDLPVDILVVDWMENSDLVKPTQGQSNPATAGTGTQWIAMQKAKYGGASENTNIASAYISLRDKQSKEVIGTFLVSQWLNESQLMPRAKREQVAIADKKYELELRFRREYKPYQITLDDVRRIDYNGSPKPRDFSSFVTVADAQTGQQQTNRIWMNNPMRYRGETFYQSGYASEADVGAETTTLQVVTNAGWLIPYVSCVLVGLGMLAHFGNTFVRFAARYDRTTTAPTEAPANPGKKNPYSSPTKSSALTEMFDEARAARRGTKGWLIPTLVCLSLVMLVAYKAVPKKAQKSDVDWYAVGQIPMEHEGRIKPLDTVARNILQSISNKTYAFVPDDKPKDLKDPFKKIQAREWLMGMMADLNWVEDALVFRMDEKSLMDHFNVDKSKRHLYSYRQIRDNVDSMREELRKIQDVEIANWSFEQKKLAEFNTKVSIFESLLYAYRPAIPNAPKEDTEENRAKFQQEFMAYLRQMQALESTNPPGVVPPAAVDPQAKPEAGQEQPRWRAFGPALFRAYAANQMNLPFEQKPILEFAELVDHLRVGDARKFNESVEKWSSSIHATEHLKDKASKVQAEAWYNHFDPVNFALFLYVFAGIVGFCQFLVARQELRRAAFWICVCTFLIHTFTIIFRIYLSGRPPVVNLYSSAVFIGWGAVLFGLILEIIFPVGLATLVAAIGGVLTLMVAFGLSGGDTMPVLEAVLDTQFWLATHVIAVTLGYTATFVAGAIAVAALIHRIRVRFDSTPLDNRKPKDVEIQSTLYRMCYGTVCFAIFFSFVGTVLGGLWADDSWGRFWGWDPKENGALMIVLWNALILHARWDRMIADRGFALLAIVGNIITAWSWFGTNQLQIGLHSYGFTSSAWYTFVGFVFVNLVAIGIFWFETRPPKAAASS